MDGTLTDPHHSFVNCVQHALTAVGAPSPDPRELRKLIGPSLDFAFRTLLPDAEEREIELAIAKYRERFVADGICEMTVYPGIADALKVFANWRVQSYVVIMRAQPLAQRALSHVGLSEFFGAIYGPELKANPDKADLVRQALAERGLSPRETVMVGDRAQDVLAARANGLRVIAVAWGYGSKQELAESSPDVIVNTVQDLLRAVQVL